ncbi:hypothetical protein TVAG_110120 [Trichomonas vaginalis G3]|uniref:Uncharacterized protein n=1 Tax=Trichomonas vaginalis (strain ATCC PRA-98 / G3) TaxID=412133 RepID=A2DGL3_TRIV3|nr:glycosyltransferase family [Trichomonas vaginalis G3]EAY20400.1 hypothetical protein TVAG_110120 [Trichomonas vaginalis G3]KAI5490554.1 glycosyltransferase family [Trichomonas vaginalis G3]|eukprot:XP_001581386.1 hypothetical protein [Trichomonas vaginalis G3]
MLRERRKWFHVKRLLLRHPSLIFSFILGISCLIYGIASLAYAKNFARVRDLTKKNKWLEITIPSTKKSPDSAKFIYKKLKRDEDNCIDRKFYHHEVRRIFDYESSKDDYDSKRMLIIGSHTSIGAALVRKYQRKNIPYTAVKSIIDFDIYGHSSDDYFANLSFKSAFIVYQPEIKRHSVVNQKLEMVKAVHKYFDSLLQYLMNKGIPFVIALPQANSPQILKVVMQYGGLYVDVPYTVDSKAVDDLDNPLMRAARECDAVGHTKVFIKKGSEVHSMDADIAAKFLRKQMKEGKQGHFSIHGATNISMKEAILTVVPQTCNVTFLEYPMVNETSPLSEQTALVGDPNADVKEMLKEEFKHFQNVWDKKPYLSLVVVGRNDNFSNGFLARTNNFVKALEYNLLAGPLANFEVVFVDYAPPGNKPKLQDVVDIPIALQNRFRFITVPVLTHYHLARKLNTTMQFLEYIAKNIGIRRASGKMIAALNPDDIISPEIFEAAAGKQFNRGTLYRVFRWDLRENWESNLTIDEIMPKMGSQSDVRTIPNIKERCGTLVVHTQIIDDQPSFKEYAILCGSGDFIMLSKDLWGAIGGFHEYPGNPNVDAAFNGKMMRLLNGYVSYTLDAPLLHQHHIRKNVQRPCMQDHEQIINDYICNGSSPLLVNYPDMPDWGLANEQFEEVRR